MNSNTFLSSFREGWFGAGGFGPALEPAVTATAVYQNSTWTDNDGVQRQARYIAGYSWQTQDAWFNPEMLGETTFIAKSFGDLIVDLLLGTINGDTEADEYAFTTGCRAATESAWLPFGPSAQVFNVQDIIDLPSLLVATQAPSYGLLPEMPGTEAVWHVHGLRQVQVPLRAVVAAPADADGGQRHGASRTEGDAVVRPQQLRADGADENLLEHAG
jgi:hypothetical protein